MKRFLPKKKDVGTGDQPAKKPQQQKYFWTVFLEKRKKKKMRPAYQALPKQPATKEERLKLIACLVLLILIIVGMPIAFHLNGERNAAAQNNQQAQPAPSSSDDKG